MSETTVHQEARSGTYLGVDAPPSFGDPAAELDALRSGCGIFDLAWRGKITASGKDRVRWLHNMVTNTVRDLPPNRGNYNLVLNAQGRIQGDLYIYNHGESLILDTDRSQVETLMNTLKRFIIMDKVELSPADAMISIGVCGPKAETTLKAAGIDASELQPLEFHDGAFAGNATLVRGPEQKPGWFEIWTDQSNAESIRNKLALAGAKPVGTEALEYWRVLRGIPQYGQDIRDRDLPQETGQMQALNYNKGCYIGQEIVERIRSRGQVHRMFTGFEFKGSLPAPGKFETDGRLLAEVTTVARVPLSGGEKNIGLGYVRREAAPAGAELNLNGVETRVVDLPFAI